MHELTQRLDEEARREAFVARIIVGTAGAVGEAFFHESAKTLVDVLDVRWVLIGRYEPGDTESAQIIVFRDGDRTTADMRLSLRDTVWEHLHQNGDCVYPDKLHKRFSNDHVMGQVGAEDCIGARLKASDGSVIGFLTILDEKPIANPEWVSQAVTLLATRAGAELERLIAKSLNERFGKIVEGSVSEAYVFSGRTFLFETVNRGARENLGYSIDELRKMTPWDIKPAFSEQEFRDFVAPLLTGAAESLQLETRHCRKNGSCYDVDVSLQYFSEPDDLFFASITDVTHLKEAERREKFLINEINHRAKNLLTVVQAIVAQTAVVNAADMPQRLARRLAALAANQDVLVHNRWRTIPMEDLVRSQLGFVQHFLDERVLIKGPDVKLQAGAAQVLGMAIHELATNAIKYGALTNERGRVTISWTLDEGQGGFGFNWTESDGPPVIEPPVKGFGYSIIVDQPTYGLSAKVEASFDPGGLRYRIEAPAREVLDDGANQPLATD
jgi:PAS domain S-box-containing protein